MKVRPLFGPRVTHRLLVLPAAVSFIMGAVMLAIGERPVTATLLSVPWFWIGLVAAHAGTALRYHAKRIERLEEELARERSGARGGRDQRPDPEEKRT